jgi:hypothetical protein
MWVCIFVFCLNGCKCVQVSHPLHTLSSPYIISPYTIDTLSPHPTPFPPLAHFSNITPSISQYPHHYHPHTCIYPSPSPPLTCSSPHTTYVRMSHLTTSPPPHPTIFNVVLLCS